MVSDSLECRPPPNVSGNERLVCKSFSRCLDVFLPVIAPNDEDELPVPGRLVWTGLDPAVAAGVIGLTGSLCRLCSDEVILGVVKRGDAL